MVPGPRIQMGYGRPELRSSILRIKIDIRLGHWWLPSNLAPAMLHSIYDLTTLCRRTLGDVPPKLVVCLLLRVWHTLLTPLSSTTTGCLYDRRRLQDVSLRRQLLVLRQLLSYSISREDGSSQNAE